MGSSLLQLTALGLDDNPLLSGGLPASFADLPHFLWASVQNTSLTGCSERITKASANGSGSALASCSLTGALAFAPVLASPNGTATLSCTVAILKSFLRYTVGMPAVSLSMLVAPFPEAPVPGAVISSGSFLGFYNCSCTAPRTQMSVKQDAAECVVQKMNGKNKGLITAIVVVAIVPQVLVVLGFYVFFK